MNVRSARDVSNRLLLGQIDGKSRWVSMDSLHRFIFEMTELYEKRKDLDTMYRAGISATIQRLEDELEVE